MPITFAPEMPEFLEARSDRPLTVLCGPNNSGKSLALKSLRHHIGAEAHMVAVNRFYHVHQLQSMPRDANELANYEHQFGTQYQDPRTNFEQNLMDLQRALSNLTDEARERLFALCGQLLDAEIQMKREEPDNDLSPRYIDIDGQNAAMGSTGSRLLLTMLAICMDARFSVFLIDEPELGLSPRVQERIARVFEDDAERERHFPAMKQLFVATHSHLFLARGALGDNVVVTRDEDVVNLTSVSDVAAFHRLQFNLLGNSLETLFLPAALVIVEGVTDHQYIERVLALRFPDRKITVIGGQGDVKRRVHELQSTLGDLDKSPFGGRLFIVLDAVHQPGLSADLEQMRVPGEHIVTWDQNGIEFVYPSTLMRDIFQCSEGELGDLAIEGDTIKAGAVERRKAELAEQIVGRLDSSTELPEQLEEKLLKPIAAAIE